MNGLAIFYWDATSWLALAAGFLLVLAFLPLRPLAVLLAAALLASAMLLVPFGWLSAFDYVKSGLGPLSAGFVIMVGFSIAALVAERPVVTARDEATFSGFVCLFGALVYASTFGLLSLDIYAIGFEHRTMLVAAGVVLVLALLLRSVIVTVWIAVGAMVWMLDLTGSRNLWDAFVDPVAWIVCICLFIAHFAAWLGRPVRYAGLRMSSRPAPTGKTAQGSGK